MPRVFAFKYRYFIVPAFNPIIPLALRRGQPGPAIIAFDPEPIAFTVAALARRHTLAKLVTGFFEGIAGNLLIEDMTILGTVFIHWD